MQHAPELIGSSSSGCFTLNILMMMVRWRRAVHVSQVHYSSPQRAPCPSPISLISLGPVGLEGDVHGSGAGLLGPEGRLVLQWGAPGEEGVLEVVVEQAADGGHVDVGEAREAAGEVGGVVVRPEETPELSVEDVLCLRPHGFSFSDPFLDDSLRCRVPVHLHVFDELGERLQPGHHVDVLLRVHDLDLLPQLGDDGSCPPAMLQRQVSQVTVDVITKIQHL